MAYDPLTEDAPTDAAHPASMQGLVIESHGESLNGVIYSPSGADAAPLALMLHGLPGHERNFDLAQILRRAGWHVVVFHYRGSWGSGGIYRFSHVIEDVKRVLDFFRDADNAETYGVDRERIIAVGHSLGGWAALVAAANGWVDEAASLAGANIGSWGDMLDDAPVMVRPMIADVLEGNRHPLHGMDTDAILDELVAQRAAWNVVGRAADLAAKKLLIVGGKRDEVLSIFDHHQPLVAALEAASAKQLSHTILDADHAFSNKRVALARLLLDWL